MAHVAGEELPIHGYEGLGANAFVDMLLGVAVAFGRLRS